MTEFCPIYWFSSPLCLNSFVRVIPPLFKKCVFSFFKISGFSVKSGTALLSNVEHGAALETNTIDRQEERRTTTHTHLTHAIWWRVHSVDVFIQTQHLFFFKKQNKTWSLDMKRQKVKVRGWKTRPTQSATHFPHTLAPCSLKCLALLNLYLFTAYLRLALSYSFLPLPPFHHLVILQSSLTLSFTPSLSLVFFFSSFFLLLLYLGPFLRLLEQKDSGRRKRGASSPHWTAACFKCVHKIQ